MTTLSASKARTYYEGDVDRFPVIATDIIYRGAAVGDNGSGYSRPLVAGDPFRGFAQLDADNSTGAAGDVLVTVKARGYIQLPLSGLAITDVGKDVYASDDDTFTLTQSTNTRIGHVSQFVSSGVGIVAFSSTTGQQTELTDNSGGTANTTIEACGAAVTGVDGTGSNAASKADVDTRLAAIANNVADLAAAINTIIRRLGN